MPRSMLMPMPAALIDDPKLPSLEYLGADLLVTRPSQRWRLARPFLGVAAYALAAYAGLWWLTPLIVFLIFVAVVTVTHDVVHGALGLSRRQTEIGAVRDGCRAAGERPRLSRYPSAASPRLPRTGRPGR